MNYFLIKSYFFYLLKARHQKGYGLHSPFVFHLVRKVFNCKYPFYNFEKIKELRNKLSVSNKVIQMCDYGAGSHRFKSLKRTVSVLVKQSSVTEKYGELLYRLVNEMKPETIIELGTSVGLSTCYLALPNKKCKVYTIEACSNTADVARDNFEEIGCDEVELINGQFQDVLPGLVASVPKLDFVFFDGHHEKNATLDYFNTCLSKVVNNGVFVFDDIHWSKGMEEAWEIIRQHPSVTVTIDLFQFGLVFFRKECQKQHFVVKY